MKARYHGHRDSNHIPIARALERAGYSVQDVSGAAGFVDLVASGGDARTVVIEIKRRDGDITAEQMRFLALWRGFAAVVDNEEQALNVMRDPKAYALTSAQKTRLLLLAVQTERTKSQKVRYGVFLEALEENK